MERQWGGCTDQLAPADDVSKGGGIRLICFRRGNSGEGRTDQLAPAKDLFKAKRRVAAERRSGFRVQGAGFRIQGSGSRVTAQRVAPIN